MMKKIAYFIALHIYTIQIILTLFTVPHAHAKELKKNAIKHIHIIGERCSGTNFIATLLRQNIAGGVAASDQNTPNHYGWKHGFVSDEIIAKSNNAIFVHVYRNPYDWIRSFHKDPWHAHDSLKDIPFSTFIRKEWYAIHKGTEMLHERNPATGKRFKDVIQLRTTKLRHFESLRFKLLHFFSAAYEVVNRDPQLFLKNFTTQFSLKQKEKYAPVVLYKGDKTRPNLYQKKHYPPFQKDDLDFIDSELDWELENKLGYEIDKDDTCARDLFSQ
jgi:hypothetical protein